MCIIGGIAALMVLAGLISALFDLVLAQVLLFGSLPFIFIALYYMLNWLSCRRRDRKRAAAEFQVYKPVGADQPVTGYPEKAQPAEKPEKLPGQGYAKAGYTLGIIGVVLALLIGMSFFTSNFSYYSASAFFSDLILFAAVGSIPVLSLVFGTMAKRRGYPEKSAQTACTLGIAGSALTALMVGVSAALAFSGF